MRRRLAVAIIALVFISGVAGLEACKKGGGLNIFTIQDDKDLGLKMEQEIAANPQEYPLLDPVQYASAYAYLDNIKLQILNSGKMQHASDFDWKLHIIHNDTVLNAFCTPGGYIYVYSGLIKYLDNASSLAGVLGHEMAHADQRHSTKQLTEQYGIATLLEVVLGKDQNTLTDIAANLTILAFSRSDESDADTHSVIYLCPTQYRADGAADFFQKIVNSGAQQPPAFLSTHPNPDNRIANLHAKESELGCNNTPSNQVELTDYAAFKNSLP
ncbi:MAG: M48 family metalloprotease [Chitinophagales bacterium]